MRVLKISIGVIVLLGLLLGASPLALKWYLIQRLQAEGIAAKIKHFGIDYIFGEISFSGVDIRADAAGSIRIFEGKADLDLWALAKRKLQIQSLTLNNADLDLAATQRVLAALAPNPNDSAVPSALLNWSYSVDHLQLTNVEFCRSTDQQCLRLEEASLSDAELRPGGGWSFTHQGPLRLRKAFLRDQASGSAIFYLGELKVKTGSWSPATVNLRQLALDNFHLIENTASEADLDTPYQTQIGSLSISALRFEGGEHKALSLGQVKAISLRQVLHKGADEQLRWPVNLAGWLPTLIDSLQGQTALALQLESFDLQGGVLAWLDKSVTPASMETLSQIALSFGPLDTEQSAMATPVALSAKLGESGALKLSGEVYPVSAEPHFRLHADVQGLNLARLSAYTRPLFGQRIEEGIVDATLDLAVAKGVVDGDTRWRLSAIRFESGGGRGLQQAFDGARGANSDALVYVPLNGRWQEEISLTYIFDTLMRRALVQLANDNGAQVLAPRTE